MFFNFLLVSPKPHALYSINPFPYLLSVNTLLFIPYIGFKIYDANGRNDSVGYGRVNALKALRRLRGPYILTQSSVQGGTILDTSQEYEAYFYGAEESYGLPDDYYTVIRHEVRKNVTYPTMRDVAVWGRGVATTGWAKDELVNGNQVNFTYGWCEPVPGTVTSTSATLRTYVYEVLFTWETLWFPAEPSNVQFGYTIHGIPANITSNTTWEGDFSLDGSVTVNSGVTLTISPGTIVRVAPGVSLTVNGTLNSQGTSSNGITFDRSGASGTWGGIVYNSGSSGLLNYCTIKNATTGVTCNGYLPSISNCTITNNTTGISASNISTSGNKISYNTIQNNTSCGIYIAYSKFICNNNIISNNGTYGINCYNPLGNYQYHPIFYNNTITGHVYGISCYTCSPYLAVLDTSLSCCPNPGHNVIKQNSVGISAGFNSYVFLGTIYYGGYNCVHNNTVHQIIASCGCTIMAQKTYWNHPNPPYYDLSDFVMNNQSTINCDSALKPPDPNGCSGLSKIAANGLIDYDSYTVQNTSTISGDNIVTTSNSDLSLLMSMQLEGRLNEVIPLYKQVFQRENNTIKGRYALCKLKECYQRLNREDEFNDYINKSVRPLISAKDELYALLVEFDNQSLFEKQDYTGVLKNLNDILKYYTNNESVYKRTMFDIGFLYLNSINDRSQASKYFSQLAAKYPNDPLVMNARYLLGKDSTKSSLAKEENKPSITQDEIPTEFELYNNYPNPFNPTTVISYQLPATSYVTLKVYDILGREVVNLVDEMKEAGYYTTTFDGTKLASGIYFTRLIVQPENESRQFVQVKKMLMMK